MNEEKKARVTEKRRLMLEDLTEKEEEEKPVTAFGEEIDPKLILKKDPSEDPEGFVTMKGSRDSGIACLAMITRSKYEDIVRFIPRNLNAKFKHVPGDGRIALQVHEMLRICYDFNILARQVVCQNIFKDKPGLEWRSEHANAIYEYSIKDLQEYIFLNGKAMLGVPSHDDPNKIHWIYTEGPHAVFDPYPIKADRYKTLSNLLIADAIIVGGVPGGAK